MKIYKHINKDVYEKGTFSIVPPTKKDLSNIFDTYSNVTLFSIGVAICSARDPYVKKIGRGFADKNVNLTKTYLQNVEIRETKHVFHFMALSTHPKTKKELKVFFAFSIIKESDNVRLLYVHFGEDLGDEMYGEGELYG